MPHWIPVSPSSGIPPGDFAQVEVEGTLVAVFNVNGEFRAIEDVCTHDGGGLAGGALEGNIIVCPRHGARFCLKTGAALTPPAYEPVRVFQCRVVNDVVEICAES